MKRIVLCSSLESAQIVHFARASGFGIEVRTYEYPPELNSKPIATDLVRDLIADIEPKYLHAPFGDLCAGSYDPLIREVTRNRYMYALKVAGEANIGNIVIHHGYVPGTSTHPKWISRFVEFWKGFLTEAPAVKCYFLENMLEHGPEIVQQVLLQLNEAPIRACLDVGHANCNSRASVSQWIRVLGNKIGYVHLHDNHGQADEHLNLGEGSIPFREVCDALLEYAPEANWALEIKTGDYRVSLDWLEHYGYLSA